MKIKSSKVSRFSYGLLAAALTIAIGADMVVPGLTGRASAAQVTSRSIEMSSSTASATGVTYLIGFTTASTISLQGIIVDFCDGSPIPGDSCTAPGGFSVGTPTATVSASFTNAGSWTAAQLNSNRTLKLTNSTTNNVNSGTAGTITLTTATNPNTADHSFYARIFTYSNASPGYTTGGSGNEGSYTDYGGVAMSTASVINITAKVMETLSFCVYGHAGACGVNSPDITIGLAYGTATVIDSSVVDTADVDFSISTNAQTGADVRMKGDTLKSGANDINAAGSSAITFNAGTENFGMRVSTTGTNMSATSPYNGGTGSQYAFNTTNTTSTYGDQICTLSGPTNGSINTLTFAATAANTTPAGTYTAAEQLIATGKF